MSKFKIVLFKRLIRGLFISNANSNISVRFIELFSRFTWQLPQTLLGFLYSLIAIAIGDKKIGFGNFVFDAPVNAINYYYGTTLVHGAGVHKLGSVCLGNFIALDNYSSETKDTIGAGAYTTMHEYGHYLQSKILGVFYLLIIGIPSSCFKSKFTEYDANLRASNYFEKVDNAFSWDEYYDQRKSNIAQTNFKEPTTYFKLPKRTT